MQRAQTQTEIKPNSINLKPQMKQQMKQVLKDPALRKMDTNMYFCCAVYLRIVLMFRTHQETQGLWLSHKHLPAFGV